MVSAGAKTGTAETGVTDANNGTFVCFAPYDDPQIAVAVVIEKGGAYIFVIRPDSIAERRLIELGPEVNNRVIVERGVVPGEKIVVEGFHKLTHGDKVDPVPVPEKSSATETEASEK